MKKTQNIDNVQLQILPLFWVKSKKNNFPDDLYFTTKYDSSEVTNGRPVYVTAQADVIVKRHGGEYSIDWYILINRWLAKCSVSFKFKKKSIYKNKNNKN